MACSHHFDLWLNAWYRGREVSLYLLYYSQLDDVGGISLEANSRTINHQPTRTTLLCFALLCSDGHCYDGGPNVIVLQARLKQSSPSSRAALTRDCDEKMVRCSRMVCVSGSTSL